MDERFTDVGTGTTLCYETFGDPADPTVLLVMGLGTQMLGWHEDLCEGLAGRGFHVVRFDNRDAGRSTHASFPPPTVAQLLTRRFRPEQYTLHDLAADAAGLVRALGVGPVHVVGASMGGMIAQTLAARHPEAVASLVSIMSMTGSRTKGQPAPAMYKYLLKPAPTDREAYLAHTQRLFAAIGSPEFPPDPAEQRERAARSFERRQDPRGTGRQLGAILKTGDRTRELASIAVPTLVVHGRADKLVRPSGGRATAKAIPGAELELIDGMGHDLPRELWPRLIAGIERTAARAGRPGRAAVPAGS